MTFDLATRIEGRVWAFGDSVDTDVIYPYYLYPSEAEVRRHTMEALCPEFPNEVRQGDLLVAGRNFGCGSSRSGSILVDVGIAAIVADSFSRIFFRQCVSQAIPAFIAPGVAGFVATGETLAIDYPARRLLNRTRGTELALTPFSSMVEDIYRAGGILKLARDRYEAERAGDREATA
jgi:3-isopropylmalate/(R)-2-methylmalate dehydratase small subunit